MTQERFVSADFPVVSDLHPNSILFEPPPRGACADAIEKSVRAIGECCGPVLTRERRRPGYLRLCYAFDAAALNKRQTKSARVIFDNVFLIIIFSSLSFFLHVDIGKYPG